MSPEMSSAIAHERARMLAAESVDVELEPQDTDWLDGHLSVCADCRAVSDEYREIHAELRSLDMPEPPRDLWARTAAALDEVDSSARYTLPAGPAAPRPAVVPWLARPLLSDWCFW